MPIAVSPTAESEYIKAMIDWTRDDVSRIHLRVTAAVGIAVLFVTQLPFERLAALNDTWLLFVGIGFLLVAAGLHLVYLAQVGRSRRELAACLRINEGKKAARAWGEVWYKWGWAYVIADGLIVVGLLVLGIVLAQLLSLSALPRLH